MRTVIFSCFAVLAVAAIPTASFADSPRRFLQKALEGDNSEIMLGQLAADRARSERVKEFGRTLSDDHSQAREEVIRLGARLGVRRNRNLSPEAREERERLQNLDGREFDREFIDYMIRDHQKDISEFQDEADEHHGPVSDLAARQLPKLQEHLEMAMRLDRSRARNRNESDRNGEIYQGDRDNREEQMPENDRRSERDYDNDRAQENH